jgi:hypothetical protein
MFTLNAILFLDLWSTLKHTKSVTTKDTRIKASRGLFFVKAVHIKEQQRHLESSIKRSAFGTDTWLLMY